MFLAPNHPGKDGSVSGLDIESRLLNKADKKSYPAELLKIMRRQAEDLLLGNINDTKGRDALMFILNVVNERDDVEELKRGELLANRGESHIKQSGMLFGIFVLNP